MTGVAEAQQRGPAGDASSRSYGLAREFAASGISVGCANTILNPVGEHRGLAGCEEHVLGETVGVGDRNR